MSERMIERDESGREIVYVDRVPRTAQWNKHINNLVEQGMMDRAMQCTRDMILKCQIKHG